MSDASRIDRIQAMLAREPDDPFLNFSLAMEYAKQGEHERALAQFARVTELDAGFTAAYRQRADLLVALARKAEARPVLAAGIAAAQRTGDRHAADEMTRMLTLLGGPATGAATP